MTAREQAIGTLVRLGVDVLSPIDADGCLLERSDAYLVAYAEARADEFSEDNVQRDEKGKFSGGGGGGGKEAKEAGGAATGEHEKAYEAEAKKFNDAKAELKQMGYSNPSDAQVNEHASAPVGFKDEHATALSGVEGKDWTTVKDPTTGEMVKAQLIGGEATGQPAEAVLHTGEVVKMPKAPAPLAAPQSPEMSAHAKAARDSAKAIVEHTKQLRSEYKKNPTAENKAKLEAAEKVGKAARSAARKAEAAKTVGEAQKHAEKASSHLAKLVGGDEEAKAYAVQSKKAPSAAADKPIDKSANHELHKAADKLLTEAEKPHPSTWSPEKVAAKEAAKKVLTDHSGAKTPTELKTAADAFDGVAKQASAAGSYWGHGYSTLAEKYREAAQPKESFNLAPGTPGNHDEAPSHSARPIASIKGEDVSSKTHSEHREKFTATLTSKEKAAALAYSGNGYSSMNSHLRSGGAATDQNRQLDKAIAKAPAPRDMVVHRGLSGPFSEKMFGGMKPGDQYVEKAYSSTSAGGSAAFGGGVELHITVPKGYPAAPIPSHHPGEREYLLRRNTKFEVTKIESTGHKVIAHVTVVHDQKEES